MSMVDGVCQFELFYVHRSKGSMAFTFRVFLFMCILNNVLAVILSNSRPSEFITDFFQASDGYVAMEWNYQRAKGPDTWPALYPQCAGFKQSPVALRTSEAVVSPEVGPVQLFGYRNKRLTMQAFNNGQTVKLKFKTDAPVKPPLKLRNYRAKRVESYELEEIHLHWGQNENQGSEHSLDGRYYPAEIHFVHKLTGLTLEQAITTPNGLAVLGAFITTGQWENAAYRPVISALRHIRYNNQSTTIKFDKTLRSLLPQDVRQFFRYDGSLTTPTCNEVVIWTVFRDPIWISRRQMDAFRQLMKSYQNEPPMKILNNFRPVQNLHGREIFKHGFYQ